MDINKLEEAFDRLRRSVLIGLAAFAEHFQGPGIKLHANLVGETEEGEPCELFAEIRRDDEVIYRHTGEYPRDTLDGLMHVIIKQEQVVYAGKNHETCTICTYILDCLDTQFQGLDRIRTEIKRAALLDSLQKALDAGELTIASATDPKSLAEKLKKVLGDNLEVVLEPPDGKCNCPVCTARRERESADSKDDNEGEQPNAS